MELNKDYGVYLEYDIPNDEEKKEFEKELERICCSARLYKAGRWYHPNISEDYKYETCNSFAFIIADREKKFHKYISKLLFKKCDKTTDRIKEAIDTNIW